VKLTLALSLMALLSGARALAQPPAPSDQALPTSRCAECHLAMDDDTLSPPARAFAQDVHARAGFTCASCHGGDPNQQDQERAHDPKKEFHGKFAPKEIPALCGKCHGDAVLMKHFNPSLRVDQLSEYRTSKHAQKLFEGDTSVAQCASCHGAHGVLPVKDSLSPVSPSKVAQTCNRCHGDAALMGSHHVASDVYAKYTRSVHFKARTEKGDLSAPTCNSCHGNHGAAPPEVGSVANVCGTCHATFNDRFRASPHWEAFHEMGLPGCVTCHSNHEIVKPSEAFLSLGPEGKCAECHEPGSRGAVAADKMGEAILRLERRAGTARSLLRRAAEAGMEVSRDQFELAKASEALTRARTDVHYFQAAAVERDVAEGLKAADAGNAAGLRALAERDYRRRGLFVSLFFILAAIGALLLKIRHVDRKNDGDPGAR
jgi:Cytochrome c3